MNEEHIKLIGECLRASAYGPFFKDEHADDPYWEIHTLFGISISELRNVSDKWPNVDLHDEDVVLAIRNSINNLHGYPHHCTQKEWAEHLSISRDELIALMEAISL